MSEIINRTSKRNISEFNIEEARGWAIKELSEIEYLIDKILLKHFDQKPSSDFEKVLLNSSILEFGKKIKLLTGLDLISNKISDKLRKISSIRNGFAHSPIQRIYGINTKSKTEIEVMKSNGKIERKNMKNYLTEFFDLRKEIIEELLKLK